MSNGVHYFALLAKHYAIERKIAIEMKRPLPDLFILQKLKRRKLVVRDKIEAHRREILQSGGRLPAPSFAKI